MRMMNMSRIPVRVIAAGIMVGAAVAPSAADATPKAATSKVHVVNTRQDFPAKGLRTVTRAHAKAHRRAGITELSVVPPTTQSALNAVARAGTNLSSSTHGTMFQPLREVNLSDAARIDDDVRLSCPRPTDFDPTPIRRPVDCKTRGTEIVVQRIRVGVVPQPRIENRIFERPLEGRIR